MSSLGNNLEVANTLSSQTDIFSVVFSKHKRSVVYSDLSEFVIIQSISMHDFHQNILIWVLLTCWQVLGCLVVGITVFMAMRQRTRTRDKRDIEQQRLRTNLDTEPYISAQIIPSQIRIPARCRDDEAIKTPAIVVTDVAYRQHSTPSLHSPWFHGLMKLKNNYNEDNDAQDPVMMGLKPPPKRAILKTATGNAASSNPEDDNNKQQNLDSHQPQALSWPPIPMTDPSLSNIPPPTPIKTTYITLPSPSYPASHASSSHPMHTSSLPRTPIPAAPSSKSATLLVPNWYQDAPLSARSIRSNMTSDTRLSIRASSTESMMFLSALRPAPPPRRLATVPSEEMD